MFTVVISCVLYPGVLWVIGQIVFPFQANGSMVNGPDGKPVGSILIAQPFTKDEYFQPRPRHCSYEPRHPPRRRSPRPTTRCGLGWRTRRSHRHLQGRQKGQHVAPDIEAWFQKDKFQGHPGIVAQWAERTTAWPRPGSRRSMRRTTAAAYVHAWAKTHPAVVAQFEKDNPDNTDPAPSDLAVVFFETSPRASGQVPLGRHQTATDGKTGMTAIEPVSEGSDRYPVELLRHVAGGQSRVELKEVPGDLVTTSGSGLDPHISLANATFQLDRVAGAWAKDTKGDAAKIHAEIEDC